LSSWRSIVDIDDIEIELWWVCELLLSFRGAAAPDEEGACADDDDADEDEEEDAIDGMLMCV